MGKKDKQPRNGSTTPYTYQYTNKCVLVLNQFLNPIEEFHHKFSTLSEKNAPQTDRKW